MKFFFSFIFIFGAFFSAYSTTYYTCNSEEWGTNEGNTTLRLSTSTDCSVQLNPRSIIFASNDVIVVQAGNTATIKSEVDLTALSNITIEVYGNLYFNNGKIRLSADSQINLHPGSDLACVNNSGNKVTCPNNEQISIGTTQLKGSELDDANNLPKPSSITITGAQPVELLFFKADENGQNVTLSWATASEENFDYFTIERSTDAANYEILGTVKGNGWSDNIINYSFTDTHPLLGRAYYRLKATDLDGTYEYFQSVMVNYTDGNKSIHVKSNPLNNEPLSFRLNFTPENEMNVVIVDITGSKIYDSKLNSGLSRYIIDRHFDKGIYFLKISTGGNIYTVRFLKE